MHLKSIDIIGFKSFANRTKLNFNTGMTAVVGPNGCGKSNISDCIRWVLGEQSAKALRGGNMADVIFNGTDTAKPLNLAEVTLTLTECEGHLEMDCNEVSVTRRVFRSGEGQYFINKKQCRLKDVQRLFMDTGIGTNSYSVLEQGKIDQILSSRPDDRRAVFEEASGITKYKSDRKEAMRKLDHTEANLLRLDDIIREVKRRIGSLQRQAGKARRYKSIQDELRGLDIYATRKRIITLETDVKNLDEGIQSRSTKFDSLKAEVDSTEAKASAARSSLQQTEQLISDAMEASIRAKSDLSSNQQLIQVNLDRVKEIEDYAQRDAKDAEVARGRLEEHGAALVEVEKEFEQAKTAQQASSEKLQESQKKLSALDQELNNLRNHIKQLRNQGLEAESQLSKEQHRLVDLEARDRSSVVSRERLAAEQTELEAGLSQKQGQLKETREQVSELEAEVHRREEALGELSTARKAKGQEINDIKTALHKLEQHAAAKVARLELLFEHQNEEFPGGARLLISEDEIVGLNREALIGPLASRLRAKDQYQQALESCLRSWVDAIVVSDEGALRDIVHLLDREQAGAARLLSLAGNTPPRTMKGPGTPLADHVECAPELMPLAERLLHHVFVVDSFDDLPQSVPADATFVLHNGTLLRGDGSAEFSMCEEGEINPLARQHLRASTEKELRELEKQISLRMESLDNLEKDETTAASALEQTRGAMDEKKRELAGRRGELQVVERESKQLSHRQEKVVFELNRMIQQTAAGDETKAKLAEDIEALRTRQADIRSTTVQKTEALNQIEAQRNELMNEVSERRVVAAESTQRIDHLERQRHPLRDRIQEMEKMIRERSAGVANYQSRIDDLKRQVQEAREQIAPLEEKAKAHDTQLEGARTARQEQLQSVTESERVLREKRGVLDGLQSERSTMEVSVAKKRVYLESALERIETDYHLSREAIDEEPEPEWEDGHIPALETIEKITADYRKKLDSMGPVNLVAIEEYQVEEEKYQELIQQQEDLLQAKENFLAMIKKINETTTEMFVDTFNKVNETFKKMFAQLFGGGVAELILTDMEDVLESGIEIVARPPGKRLQNISLLSGGERTMTAVGLLFSLYTVKPSPFCVLDELDAALDDANIGRFVGVVREFVERSQFIVITHNRQTIGAADVLYGVSMQQKGISSIVSVKLSDYEDQFEGGDKRKRKAKQAEWSQMEAEAEAKPEPEPAPEPEPEPEPAN